MDRHIVLQVGDIVRVKPTCRKAIVIRITRRYAFGSFGPRTYVVKYQNQDALVKIKRSLLQFLHASSDREFLIYTSPMNY